MSFALLPLFPHRVRWAPSRFVALALCVWGCGADGGGTSLDPDPVDSLPSDPPAISIALSQSSIVMTQGQDVTAMLNITRTNFTGAVAVTVNVVHNGLTVSADPASVTGNAATITVRAAGYTEPDTIHVVIGVSGTGIAGRATVLGVTVNPGELNASSAEALHAAPGVVWRFRGTEARSLTARIDGQDATVTYEGDSVALVAVPALAAFQPCLASSTLPVFLATATGSTHQDVPAEAPLVPTLSAGAHAPLDAALTRDCVVLLPVGSYAMVAAVPDVEAYAVSGQLRTDSARLLLNLAIAGAPAAAVSRHGPVPIEPPSIGLRAEGPPSWHGRPPPDLPRVAGVAGAECRLLSGVGDSIEIPTRRDAVGQFRWSAANDPPEWWHLMVRTPNVDVVVDTGGRRAWAEDAGLRATMDKVIALYDTAFVPIWAELYSNPLSDMDGNGRMIWFAPWNSGEGGGGGIGTYLQSGCTDNARNGEHFYAPLDMFSSDPVRTPAYLAAYFRGVVFHEATHTNDLARRTATHGRWFLWPPHHQVSTEGIAVFVPEYWNLKRSGAPLTGNQTAIAPSTDGIVFPGNLWEVYPRIAGNYHAATWADNFGYAQSGRFFLWVVAQAVRQGRPLSYPLTALSTATRATYGAMYRAGTGSTMSDRDVLVNWVLSWYADDRVTSNDLLLDYTPWNTVDAYTSRGRAFPLPAASLSAAGAWAIALGDPDAKVIEVMATEPMRVRVDADGALGPRVVLQLLRVQ